MTTNYAIDAAELNRIIDPLELLAQIGYSKSSPKVSGGEVRDFCPIHKGDKKLSLAINQQTHCFFCHSCQAKGDLINLYMASLDITDFPTAINELATKFACKLVSNPHQNTSYSPTQKEMPNSPCSTRTDVEATECDSSTLATDAWNNATDKGSHNYFSQKKIEPCPGVRYGNDKMGNPSIVVPFYDVSGKIQTVQYINSSGKFFLSGAHKKGNFFPFGKLQDGEKTYVAEGLATAATIYNALDKERPVVSAGDAGNIPTVVDALRKKHPKIQIVLALDNDETRKGILEKIKPTCTYCMPNFDGLVVPEKTKVTDFNDLISICDQSLEFVKSQIQKQEEDSFFFELGSIVDDNSFSEKLKGRTYYTFEAEHKKLFASGGLVTGFRTLDEQLYFSKGDLVTVQAMSNHGKSTFMLQLAHRFLTNSENTEKHPMCIFITYESSPIRVEEKFINILGHDCGEGTAILYDRKTDEKYLYPDPETFTRSISTYNRLLSQKKINILRSVSLEKLEGLIDLYKRNFQSRTLVFFLDYLQIIDTDISSEGWERIKAIAYKLEQLAIDKEIIIISACQVNEKRQTREGRDIYNASTTVLDLLNHSHDSLKANEDLKRLYKDKIGGESVHTLSAIKQKHGETFEMKDSFLFNGHRFKENRTDMPEMVISSAQQIKNKK